MPPEPTHPRAAHFAPGTQPVLLVHGSHHKMGTVYIHTVLRELCQRHDLGLLNGSQADLDADVDVFFQNNSRIAVDSLPPFRGSHMVRDLRDVVISGYRYHQWTREEWASRPMSPPQVQRLGCEDVAGDQPSYRELLNRVDPERGIGIEIRRVGLGLAASLRRWDFTDERFLEIRFEDLMAAPADGFERILRWYGLTDEIVDSGCEVAARRSLESINARPVEQRPPHARSGGSTGKWQELFTDEHKRELKELAGDLLIDLGYAEDDAW